MRYAFSLGRRSLSLGFGFALTALAFSALTLQPAAAEKVKIIHATPPNTFGVPHYIAQDKGWYKDIGIEIEDVNVQGDANSFRALMAGEGDLCEVGPATTMAGYLKGAKVKIFGSWQSRVDYQFIANKAKSSGKIDKTLEGGTIAGSGGLSMLNHMVSMVMKKHGLDASGVKNIAIGGHADRLAAVIAGKADMTLVSTMYAMRAKDQVLLLAPIAKELGGMGYLTMTTRDDILANPERRGALKKLMLASVKGARYAAVDPEYAAVSLQKRLPEISMDLIRDVVAQFNANKLWDTDGGASDETMEFTAKSYLEYKEIDRMVTPQEILYKGIADEVNKELAGWNPKS